MMLRALETQPEKVHVIFDLMISMSRLPPALTSSDQQLCGTDPPGRVWEDLPHLGRSLGAEWSGWFLCLVGEPWMNLTDPECILLGKLTPPTHFAAANVLIGRLMPLDEERFEYHLEALWTLRDALEVPILGKSDQEQLARLCRAVPAAIKIIETIGQRICQWCHELDGKQQEDPGPGGPFWKGQRSFCIGRWKFWQKRLLELSNESSLEEKDREGAKEAAETMLAFCRTSRSVNRQ